MSVLLLASSSGDRNLCAFRRLPSVVLGIAPSSGGGVLHSFEVEHTVTSLSTELDIEARRSAKLLVKVKHTTDHEKENGLTKV